MLCEECQKKEATVMITVTVGGEMTSRHLCPDCMKKMESSFAAGDVQSFLSSLLSLLSASPKAPELVCSKCGLSYEEFQHTGKLGCAQCYKDFQEQLRPLLLRIHGRSQHAGRVPQSHQKEREMALCLDTLRKEMDEAVAREDFEQAARLRDEIRAMAASAEGGDKQ